MSFSLIFAFNSLFGQSNANEYNFVSINEDITQSAITSIYKDAEGFIWITTYGDGIVRYNSVDFKSYNQGQNSDKKSLNSSIVFSIFQDSQKNIWVGTELGLNIYNNKLDKFENIDLDKFVNYKKFDFKQSKIQHAANYLSLFSFFFAIENLLQIFSP